MKPDLLLICELTAYQSAKTPRRKYFLWWRKKYGKEYASQNFYKSKSKNAQEAHEAVRPTNINLESAGNNPEQEKLYELIRARTLASQMSDAKLLKTKITANIDGENIPSFGLNGSVILFPGWISADPSSRGEDVLLPKFSAGEKLKLLGMKSEGKRDRTAGKIHRSWAYQRA